MTGPQEQSIDQQYVFDVSRDHGALSVTAKYRDLKSGMLSESLGDYSARFRYGYNDSQNLYLEMYHCYYEYPYIEVGFTCFYYRIPAKLTDAAVKGDDTDSSLILSTNYDFTVNVVKKAAQETSCDVRGNTTIDGVRVYYTRDSKYFASAEDDLRCFADEQDALKAGYTKSYTSRG